MAALSGMAGNKAVILTYVWASRQEKSLDADLLSRPKPPRPPDAASTNYTEWRASAFMTVGTSMENREPLPGVELTASRRPRTFAVRFAMARPRPIPGAGADASCLKS